MEPQDRIPDGVRLRVDPVVVLAGLQVLEVQPGVVPGQQHLELDLDLTADNVDIEDVEDRQRHLYRVLVLVGRFRWSHVGDVTGGFDQDSAVLLIARVLQSTDLCTPDLYKVSLDVLSYE